MDDYVIQQKIQKSYAEPRAPEALIRSVILRAQAVSMGVQAHKQLETAPAEKVGELTSKVLVGQLAAVSKLPQGAEPEMLAQQLAQEPAFVSALRGGNVLTRLDRGELIQAITGRQPEPEKEAPELSAPQKEGPAL